ncbi:hypothetical protein AAY473_019029 [Plecturocebus cupreus]
MPDIELWEAKVDRSRSQEFKTSLAKKEFETNLGNMAKPCLYKHTKISWVVVCTYGPSYLGGEGMVDEK